MDKRGKRVDKQDTTMASFYQLENDSEEGQTPQRGGVEGKYYDEEGKFKWEAQSSSSDDEGDHEDDEDDEQEADQEVVYDQDD